MSTFKEDEEQERKGISFVARLMGIFKTGKDMGRAPKQLSSTYYYCHRCGRSIQSRQAKRNHPLPCRKVPPR